MIDCEIQWALNDLLDSFLSDASGFEKHLNIIWKANKKLKLKTKHIPIDGKSHTMI